MKKANLSDFKQTMDDFQAKGYKPKDVTMSSKMAIIKGVIFALPFVILLGVVYRVFLTDKASLLEINGISFYATFIAIIVVSVFIHELLHGFGWIIASRKGWGTIKFNISALMPSCSCRTVLTKHQYLFGVLLPFVILGTISIIFMFVYPGTVSMLTMLVVFFGAGADLVIAFDILHEKSSIFISDHPTDAGFISYSKIQ